MRFVKDHQAGPKISPQSEGLSTIGRAAPNLPQHLPNPDAPWDYHICRSVGVVWGANVGIYIYIAVPWSVWVIYYTCTSEPPKPKDLIRCLQSCSQCDFMRTKRHIASRSRKCPQCCLPANECGSKAETRQSQTQQQGQAVPAKQYLQS